MNTFTIWQDQHISKAVGAHRISSVLNRREMQQDVVLSSPYLWAIADGMGGHDNGDLAARAALEALGQTVTAPCGPGGLYQGFAAAQKAVAALATGRYASPGTTLVALVAGDDGRSVHGAWIGDSRAYLVGHDGRLESLTEDHVTPWGSLTYCLGDHGEPTFHVDAFTLRATDGRSVLLTTDGAHGPYEDDDRGGSLDAMEIALRGGLDAFVSDAAARGTDNTTAALIDLASFVGQGR